MKHEDTRVLRDTIRLYLLIQRRGLHADGLPHQGRFLVLLLRGGPQSQAEFGRSLGLEKSWISRVVDKLVEQGWVERAPHPEDRRSVLLQLTTAGEALAREVDARMDAKAAIVLDHLTQSERARVVDALGILNNTLQSLASETSQQT